MENDENGAMAITTGIKYYLGSLIIFIISLAPLYLSTHDVFIGIALIAYISCGILLNRTILRNLIEFHPVYNTLDNVFRYKWNMIVIWPIGYMFLLLKLSANKII